MRDVNCYVKVASTVHRKDEAEFLNHYDAPFAASNNQTDKQLARKSGAPAKSETYNPSSPSQVWRKKAISTGPLEEHDEESMEKSMKPLEKTVEINIPSSPSQVWRKKVISTIPLEEPSQQFIEKSTRPSEEPSEESIEKSTKSSEEIDEESIEKSIITLLEESDEESIEKSIVTHLEESDEESIEKGTSTHFEESIEKSIIRLLEELDTTPSKEPDERSIEESAKPSQEPDEESVVERHVHYIRREGFGKANQEVAYMCGFCEKDLAIAPFREEEEPQPFPKEEFYWEFLLQQEEERLESSLLLPEVCIFPCGHAFHSLCLQIAQLEEHLSDTPCSICITLS